MFKNGIIKGPGDGSINPGANTTREQAVLLVVRTYEKYLWPGLILPQDPAVLNG